MAGYEHEAKQIVANFIVERGVEVRHSHLLDLELAAKFLVLALKPFVAAKRINRTVLCSGHEPSARVIRDARFRPLLECGDESVLREFLGNADITNDARKTGNDPGRLDSPNGVDGTMCIGGRHDYPSQHLRLERASQPQCRKERSSSWVLRGEAFATACKGNRRAHTSGEPRFRLPSLASVSCVAP